MDPAFWAYTSAVVMLLGNLAQFFLRLQDSGKKSPLPNDEYCDRLVKGKIYEHEVHCSNLGDILSRIAESERRATEGFKMLTERLASIEAKLDHHIDKG